MTTATTVEAPAPLAVGAKRLAGMLGVSVRTVRLLDASGKLPRPVRIGAHSVRWPVAELEAWLAARAPDRATWETIRANGRAD